MLNVNRVVQHAICTCKKLRITFWRAIMLMKVYAYTKNMVTLEWDSNGRKDKSCALALLLDASIYIVTLYVARIRSTHRHIKQIYKSLFFVLVSLLVYAHTTTICICLCNTIQKRTLCYCILQLNVHSTFFIYAVDFHHCCNSVSISI